MILHNCKRIASGMLLAAGIAILSGCAAQGHDDAVGMVKKQFFKTQGTDAFQEVDYKVDSKNNLAWLDYKNKNSKGNKKAERAYFIIQNGKLKWINTSDVPREIVDSFAKGYPEVFEQSINSYRKLNSLYFNLSNQYSKIDKDISLVDQSPKDFYEWLDLYNDAVEYNDALKDYRSAYESAAYPVQYEGLFAAFYSQRKYMDVMLAGTYYSFTASWRYSDNYVKTYTKTLDEFQAPRGGYSSYKGRILPARSVANGFTDSDQFHRYSNGRFHIHTWVPDFMEKAYLPANGDGCTFKSRDGSVVLSVSGSYMIPGQNIDDAYGRETDPTITYKARGGNWYVTSGIKNGNVYYKKKFFGTKVYASLYFAYPVRDRENYDWINAVLDAHFISEDRD